jgi:dolichyl-phosphate beta-glucosyltransferase
MKKSIPVYLSIVIPAYNEEKRIELCLKKIYEFMKNQNYLYEVIVSDDGSKDQTKEIVRRYKEHWLNLVLLENVHKGKAPAIISGIYRAIGKYTIFTDVDLSVPIDELPKMLNWVENYGYDVSIATREGVGAKRIGEPVLRHLMGRVFNTLVQIVLLPGVNDTQCGFKLFKTEAVQKIFKYTKLYSPNDKEITGGKVSAFDVEILFVAKKLGYTIKEVPVTWYYVDGSKVHNLKDSYYNAKDVFRVKLNSLLRQYP